MKYFKNLPIHYRGFYTSFFFLTVKKIIRSHRVHHVHHDIRIDYFPEITWSVWHVFGDPPTHPLTHFSLQAIVSKKPVSWHLLQFFYKQCLRSANFLLPLKLFFRSHTSDVVFHNKLRNIFESQSVAEWFYRSFTTLNTYHSTVATTDLSAKTEKIHPGTPLNPSWR